MSSGADVVKSLAPVAVGIAALALGPGGWVGAAIAMSASAATSMALNAAMPAAKPKLPEFDLGGLSLGDGARNVRQPITTRKIVYGRARCGDAIVFLHSTGNKEYLHLLIMCAGHPVDGFEDVWVNDEVVEFDPATHEALPVGGAYNRSDLGALPFLWVWTGDGSTAGDADLLAAIRAGCPDLLTTDHTWEGCAKIYARLRWGDGSAWAAGIPQITAVVRGKKVYDPRTSATAWSANAPLCQADYIACDMGLNEGWGRIDETELIVAANESDEDVALAAGGTEKRYEVNGIIDTADAPESILQSLLSASAGQAVYTAGRWVVRAGSWVAPDAADELTADDIVGPVRITARTGRRDLFNGVKGVFRDPDQNWQPVDFPPVQVAAWLAEDQGEELWRDVEMPFTVSPAAAQRLARIDLEKARRQIVLAAPCSHRALRYQVGQVIPVTLARYGFSAKAFEVKSWSFVLRDEDDAPTLGCDLVLREVDSGIYAWTTADEQTVSPAARTTLPDARSVSAPTDLACGSGTEHLYVRLDGTVFSRIRVSWTDPSDSFVTGSGGIEVEYKQSVASRWSKAGVIPFGTEETFILDVQDGVSYDVRIRSRNYLGVTSDWSDTVTHAVVGKSAKPTAVSVLSAWQEQYSNLVSYKWTPIADADRDGYELRYGPQAAFVWENANIITSVTKGTYATNSVLPPGAWTIGIKAVDTTKNYSENPTTVDITVVNNNDVVFSVAQYPAWPGALSNGLVHSVSNRLVPLSTVTASAAGWACFDEFVPSPVAEMRYTAPEYDVGFDAKRLRVWADIRGALGPGETVGSPDPTLQIDHKSGAGAYDGFEDWTIGEVDARYVKTALVLRTSTGVGYVEAFTPTVDVPERTETGGGVAVPDTGQSIGFSANFHNPPRIFGEASNAAANRAVFSPVSASGATCTIYNRSTQAAVADTLRWWEATGA